MSVKDSNESSRFICLVRSVSFFLMYFDVGCQVYIRLRWLFLENTFVYYFNYNLSQSLYLKYIIYTLNEYRLIFKEYYTTSKYIAATLSKSIHNFTFLFLLLLFPFACLSVINIQYIFTIRIVKR